MKIVLLITMLLFACQSQQETKNKNEEKKLKDNGPLVQHKLNSAKPDTIASVSSFLDSIVKKYELSIEQIRIHTSIDSVYYTGMFSDVGFAGDTVFNILNGCKAAIIVYNDRRSCIYKFFLVLNPDNQNTANKIIYTDCDHDESADYTTLRYKLLRDSIFETIETYIPANSKAQKIQKQKWKIFNTGKIDSL